MRLGLLAKFRDEPERVDPALSRQSEHAKVMLREACYGDVVFPALRATGAIGSAAPRHRHCVR